MSSLLEQLRETSFHFYSPYQLFAVLESRDTAEAAVAALLKGGFAAGAVHTWFGAQGAALLDPHGRRHGVAARVWRTAQALTGEQQALEQYVREIRAGRVCVGVDCPSPEEVTTARALLEAHGATLVTYTAAGSIEEF